jgi:anti-anti-sigma factor
MEQRLYVVVSVTDGAACVRPEGVLDIYGAARFEHEVETALDAQPREVVVDLRGLTFLDSIGLRSLFRACGWCERKHVDLHVVAGGAPVMRILRATGADVWLPLCDEMPGGPLTPSLAQSPQNGLR